MLNFKSNHNPLIQVELLKKVKLNCDVVSRDQIQPYATKNTKKKNKSQKRFIRKNFSSLGQFRSEAQQFLRNAHPYVLAVLNIVIDGSTKISGHDVCLNEIVCKLKEIFPQEHWYTKKVSDILHFLADQKLITIQFRYKDQSIYYPNPLFNDRRVKRKFRSFLPALTEDKLFISKYFTELRVIPNPDRDRIIALNANITTSFRSILNPSSLVSGSVVRCGVEITRAYAREEKQIVKKGLVMTPMIEKVSGYLQLTDAGKISLLAYPEEALAFAHAKMNNLEKLQKPYFFFIKQCKEYCKQFNIVPDIQKAVQARLEHGISPAADFVDLSLPKVPLSTPPPQKEKKKWICTHGCTSTCTDGSSAEHSQRGLWKIQGKTARA